MVVCGVITIDVPGRRALLGALLFRHMEWFHMHKPLYQWRYTMAMRNFSVVVPLAELKGYLQIVLDAGNKGGVPLRAVAKKDVTGNTEVWRLKAKVGHGKTGVNKRRTVIVSAYESGSVNFQGVNPERIGLDETIVNKWE